jgi:hypothetical protein
MSDQDRRPVVIDNRPQRWRLGAGEAPRAVSPRHRALPAVPFTRFATRVHLSKLPNRSVPIANNPWPAHASCLCCLLRRASRIESPNDLRQPTPRSQVENEAGNARKHPESLMFCCVRLENEELRSQRKIVPFWLHLKWTLHDWRYKVGSKFVTKLSNQESWPRIHCQWICWSQTSSSNCSCHFLSTFLSRGTSPVSTRTSKVD